MKKVLFIIPLILFLFLPMACDEKLDINTNPLAATKADPNAVLPFVIVQYSNRKISEIGTRMADVYQHVAATFNSPRQGSTATTLTGNMWSMLYTQMLSNLSLVEKDAKSAGATSNNVAAIAIILKSLAYHDLTSLFEDVPFTQALNSTEFPTPTFDTQQTVFTGVVTLLDEAVALIDEIPSSGVFNVSGGDLIYGGNMDSWRRFARSLQLRTLMLIRNKDTSVDSKISAIIAENRFINTNSSAAMLRYPGTAGNENAWYQLLTDFGTGSNEDDQNWGPSQLIRDLLFDANDPRLELWCIPGGNGDYTAYPIGTFPDDASARYRDAFLRADLPDIWFLPSEISFYKAELALKGVINGNADAFYRQGLNEILTFWGQSIPGAQITLSNTEITNFIATKPNLSTLSSAEALIEVGEQQYLEAFWRPVEAWNTVRRNKVPNVGAAPGATITSMLKRFNYPPAEISANPNTPVNKVTDAKMWFEN